MRALTGASASLRRAVREEHRAGERRGLVAAAWLVALAVLSALGCQRERGPAVARGDGRARVAVSVAPLAFLADRIGGDRVESVVLAPPGADPHGWEPTPRQLAAVEGADLFVAVGHPGFAFEQRFLTAWRADRPDLAVVSLSAALPPPRAGAAPELASDPHLWLSPEVMRETARRIAAELARRDPDHAGEYHARLAALLAEIDAADAALAAALRGRRGRAFLAYHAAWGHLADAYGLRQLAVEHNGREPGPRQMVAVVARARAEGVSLVFAQRGTSRQGADTLAAELGAEVVDLDPLAYDWPASMRALADAFTRAFDAA
jgi:zinc transport system substrate-binding protein